MNCIGYDYGTTNSIVVIYQGESSTFTEPKRRSSAYDYDGEYVRSPKKLISTNQIEKEKIRDQAFKYIKFTTYEFFKNTLSPLINSSKEPFHLVLTVPNSYMGAQCEFLQDTVYSAGKEFFGEGRFTPRSVSIIPEPIAAALYYVYKQVRSDQEKPLAGLVTVCDIGGGTTDIAAVRYNISVREGKRTIEFKVMCTAGDSALGGDNIDEDIARDLDNCFRLSSPQYSSQYDERLLHSAVREMKLRLSCAASDDTRIVVALRAKVGGHPVLKPDGSELLLSMRRKYLDETVLNREGTGFIPRFRALLRTFKNECDKSLNLADSVIVPVGGTSQIPILQDIMRQELGGTIFHLSGNEGFYGRAPIDCVAFGAALYSASLNKCLSNVDKIAIVGRTSHTISIRYENEESDQLLGKIVTRNMPSGDYLCEDLTPLRYSDNERGTFCIDHLDFYEGEGDYIGDDRFGPKPNLYYTLPITDELFSHGEALSSIPIKVTLHINEFGRLQSVRVRVPRGREDGTDFDFFIDDVKADDEIEQ